uniref:Secreted protein n=1 Tax=Lepeophtheirus salmonis TaxID=72036 RepID=A0A0K2UGH4_LEPSM
MTSTADQSITFCSLFLLFSFVCLLLSTFNTEREASHSLLVDNMTFHLRGTIRAHFVQVFYSNLLSNSLVTKYACTHTCKVT